MNDVRFHDFGTYIAAQAGAYAAMSEHERAQLHAWERGNLKGGESFADVSTADWPGWVKYIGWPPWRGHAANSAKRPPQRKGETR